MKLIGVKVMVTLASMFFESSSRNTWFLIIKHRRVRKMNGVAVCSDTQTTFFDAQTTH